MIDTGDIRKGVIIELDGQPGLTHLREEQLEVVTFALIPDLDMAGARGAALAALDSLDEG